MYIECASEMCFYWISSVWVVGAMICLWRIVSIIAPPFASFLFQLLLHCATRRFIQIGTPTAAWIISLPTPVQLNRARGQYESLKWFRFRSMNYWLSLRRLAVSGWEQECLGRTEIWRVAGELYRPKEAVGKATIATQLRLKSGQPVWSLRVIYIRSAGETQFWDFGLITGRYLSKRIALTWFPRLYEWTS